MVGSYHGDLFDFGLKLSDLFDLLVVESLCSHSGMMLQLNSKMTQHIQLYYSAFCKTVVHWKEQR